MQNDDDDFFCDDTLDSKYELKIENRDTNRLKNEMKLTGYRDAYQKEMENELCLQYGFDIAYKLFSQIGYLIGQIRSILIYLNVLKNDSSFLSQFFTKLDHIESYNYESLIEWSSDSTLSSAKLNEYLLNLESGLNKIKDHLLNSSFTKDFKQLLISCLNELSLDKFISINNNEDINFLNEFENIKLKK